MNEKDSRVLILEALDNLVSDLVVARKPVRQEMEDALEEIRGASYRPQDGLVELECFLRDFWTELHNVWETT